jgi:hypothetical protein
MTVLPLPGGDWFQGNKMGGEEMESEAEQRMAGSKSEQTR